jgi:hypothetical protein
MLTPHATRPALSPKTVYEIHLVIRGALGDAVRRGLLHRNVTLIAHPPRLRSIPQVEQRAWTAEELQAFLRAAADHRLFPALWLALACSVAGAAVLRSPSRQRPETVVSVVRRCQRSSAIRGRGRGTAAARG